MSPSTSIIGKFANGVQNRSRRELRSASDRDERDLDVFVTQQASMNR